MSEKVSLLQSIPPVQKESGESGSVSLLSQTTSSQAKTDSPAKQNVDRAESAGAGSVDSGNLNATETVAAAGVAEEAQTISAFQFVAYASFVLNFLLAGFAAVILFKKVSKVADERFSSGIRALAIGSVVVVLHGFFVTYLYASYLNDPNRSVPLFMTLALWMVLGPFVGFVTRNVLARKEKPNRSAALFDGGFYAFIFALSAFGVSPAVSTNGALLLTIAACFLMIMPIARSLTAYKVACARHRELKETSSQVLIYGLLLIPALLPLLAFVHIFGMSELLTLFLVNFITIDFIMVSTISMLMASSYFIEASEAAGGAAGEQSAPAPKSAPQQSSTKESGAQAAPTEDQTVVSGNPEDPIIQFLNSEGADREAPSADEETPKAKPRVQPPRKPSRPGVAAPKKPSPQAKKTAPNAPQKVKAPSKPKKRQ